MSGPARLPAPSTDLVRLTRNALTHLYDSAYLENHPLAHRLARANNVDRVTRAQRLRRILLDCIEALRPQVSQEGGVEASRAFAILTYRYVDGMSMDEIAGRRALSERQAYRELERGLEAVAALLQEYISECPTGEDLHDRTELSPPNQLQIARAEVDRLRPNVHPESFATGEVVQGVLDLLTPILAPIGVSFDIDDPACWPPVVADRTLFRQALLNLLTYAGRDGGPRALRIRGRELPGTLEITVADVSPEGVRVVTPRASYLDPVRLEIAQALIEAQSGRIEVSIDEGGWRARITLRTSTPPTILIVDDNEDLISLFQRFVAGQPITVTGVKDSREAQRLAADLQPELILVDVMLPHLDGWDVLRQLKTAPETRSIPVVVCSVLYEPEIARRMGASDYLTKPVQQADLRSILDRHLVAPP